MRTRLRAHDARQSMNAAVSDKGLEIREKHGPGFGWAELQQLLQDRSCVRCPSDIAFDPAPLQPSELAHPVGNGDRPEVGFTICVPPVFRMRWDRVPSLVLYQLVLVNYGAFASPDDAETFGASVPGLSKNDSHRDLCAMADEIGGCQAQSISPRIKMLSY